MLGKWEIRWCLTSFFSSICGISGGGAVMSVLDDLKPKSKLRVMDLIHEAGVDVSDWSNFKGGKKNAAANPKYCYEWSFIKPGEVVVLNWWHDDLREEGGVVWAELNLRKVERANGRPLGKVLWTRRARNFDGAVKEAKDQNLPIRMIINDGERRYLNASELKPSTVNRRILDPLSWSVKEYDEETGDFILVRGDEGYSDQYSVQPESKVLERRPVSGMAFVRDPALRAKALQRAKGLCEYCGALGFRMENGTVFLETHHVVPLFEGGIDAESNIAAICPNHHREAHHGMRATEIRQALLSKLKRLCGK